MSKVKDYVDSKSKSLHRLRRYETEHKKNERKKKIRNNTYGSHGWCGYYMWGGECYIDYDGEVCGDRWYEESRLIESSDGMFYLCDDGMLRKVVGIKQHPVKKINHGNAKNYYRHLASRKLRRKRIDDESPVLKGNNYKKEYDVAWIID